MNIDHFLGITKAAPGDERREEIRREKTAVDFEELFARHLVNEMSKNTFRPSEGPADMGQSGTLYREFITDALAGELAAQRKLGIAEMVLKYQERNTESSGIHRNAESAEVYQKDHNQPGIRKSDISHGGASKPFDHKR